MSISPEALTTLIVTGFVIGGVYAALLILAFRYLGRAGGAGLAAVALVVWSVAFVTDTRGRFQGAAVSLRLAMIVLIIALSVVPPLAIDRARRGPGNSYIRQAVHGIASFYLAIVGSLAIGLAVYLAGQRGGWQGSRGARDGMTLPTQALRARMEQHGFVVLPPVLPESTLRQLTEAVEALAVRVDLGERGGARGAFQLLPALTSLAVSEPLWSLASGILGPDTAAVRAMVFDKTPDANWKVAWHQDVTIAVRERREAAGFGPWSSKAGVPHVRAPVQVLRDMLTLRVHLDPCGRANGPVRVIPGSHRLGRLNDAAVREASDRSSAHDCLVEWYEHWTPAEIAICRVTRAGSVANPRRG